MRRGTWGLLLAVVVIGLAACGGGDDGEEAAAPATTQAEEAAGPVTVELAETNGSGISGTGTLTPSGADSFEVVLDVNMSEKFASHPAHIHEGTCAEYAELTDFDAQFATVRDSLHDVVDGKSTTEVLLTPLVERTTGGYSINLHEPTGSFPTVACGDIPQR